MQAIVGVLAEFNLFGVERIAFSWFEEEEQKSSTWKQYFSLTKNVGGKTHRFAFLQNRQGCWSYLVGRIRSPLHPYPTLEEALIGAGFRKTTARHNGDLRRLLWNKGDALHAESTVALLETLTRIQHEAKMILHRGNPIHHAGNVLRVLEEFGVEDFS